MPSDAIIRSAGPLIVVPRIIGLTPTTIARVSRSASRTPATASRGPILTTGLLGAIAMRSASRIASSTPGAAVALSIPPKRIARTSSSVRRFTKYSWNVSVPASVSTIVRMRSSDTGSRRSSRPNASTIVCVTSDSVAPSRINCVRCACVARSPSPNPNHVS